MIGSEKELTRRGRLVIFVVLWVVGIPVFIMLYLLLSWVALLILAGAIWASVDYLKKGDFFSAVDRSVTTEGQLLAGFEPRRKRRHR